MYSSLVSRPPASTGRPPTGRDAVSSLSGPSGRSTPLAQFVARIEMRIANEKALRTTSPTNRGTRHSPERERAKRLIATSNVVSLISSPLRKKIIASAQPRPLSEDSTNGTAFRPETPQDWIAANKEALATNLNAQSRLGSDKARTKGHGEEDAFFRALLKDTAMRTVGARSASALSRAFAEAPSAADVLHDNHVFVNTNRLF